MNRITRSLQYHGIIKSDIPIYKPGTKKTPPVLLSTNTAWKGLEKIIEDILITFKIERKTCIEFGVEFGYSSVVFSNYFDKVVGVDTFEGDQHTNNKIGHYESTKKRLSEFKNIEIYKSDYREWIIRDNKHYNFAHVDIVHTYEDTYKCGLWAVEHSDCAIFHDTESFPEVRQAVKDIARDTGKRLFNYPWSYGLGIITS